MARIALLVIAAALVTAAPTHAAVKFGSTLQGAPSATFCSGSQCTLTTNPASGGTLAAPVAGVLTRWRVKTGTQVTPATLQVIHRNANDAVETGRSDEVVPAPNAISEHETRIPIAAGDYLALMCCNGAPGGEFLGSGAATFEGWAPPVGAVPVAPTISGPGEVLINADIEPDTDGDVFGDETQDNCVGLPNPAQNDRDHDGRGDACDVCPDQFGAASNGCPIPASPPPPPPNRAPTVRFRSPLAGTAIGPSFRIQLDVADDRGAPTVSVFDDDGTICVLRRAPYACTWTPTGADVGRATLLASAVDQAGLSTLGIVRVRVNRFAASLTQRQRHRKGITRVSGRLVLPAGVTRAQGCSGTVRVRLRKARRTAKVTRRCTYSAKLPFRPGRARVRFGGNSVLAPT
jgi:Bacterial Ig domain